jgi:orotate phosphoribosyltransferase
MDQDVEGLILRLYDIGAVVTGGTKVKHHQQYPDAPEMPVYFNLRDAANTKPGPLTQEEYGTMGRLLYRLAKAMELQYDIVAGVPVVGDHIAEAFVRAAAADGFAGRQVFLEMVGSEGNRRISRVLGPLFEHERRLLVLDDVVTRGGSKKEVIAAVDATGRELAGLLVVLDHQQGGLEAARSRNLPAGALVTLSEVLILLQEKRNLDPAIAEQALRYPQDFAEYLRLKEV